MPLIAGNPNAVGTDTADILLPFNGTGNAETASGGEGNDTIFGNRLTSWLSYGNANQTYTTAMSIDASLGWSLGGTASPTVGDTSVPFSTVYGQSSGGYVCYSLTLAANATMTLDIDAARSTATGLFDAYVEVLSASTGAVLAQFDDSTLGQGGLGSTSIRDSYGQFTAGAAGTYIIRVGRYATATTSQALLDGDMFALNISATGHAALYGQTGGNSIFYGEGGDDYLIGYVGSDTLDGGSGDDQLHGFAGGDLLYGGAGNDLLDGGDGYDIAVYTANSGVAVDLRITTAQDTLGEGTDTLTGIEALSGTTFNDTLNGDDFANGLTGNQGDDILNGWGGDDYIVVGLGADTASGGDGTDTINFAHTSANWTVNAKTGTASNSIGATVSFSGFEIYTTASGNDTIYSNGNGQFYGGDGNDLIYAANGSNEKLDGGVGGVDTLDVSYFTGTYVINMVTGNTNYGELFTNFENLIAGNGPNTITGTAAANNIRTGSDADTVNAGDGDDVVEGGAGNDVLDGQSGFDIASYEHAAGGVTVSLALQGAAQATGGAGSDTLSRFEGLRGSAMIDMLTGDGLANILIGGAGNDVLHGGDGDDVILWLQGDGSDDIDGGADADTLNLRSATSGWTIDLNAGGTGTNGTDVLTLSGIERIDGSDFNDDITMSNDGGSVVNGFGGDDHIHFGISEPNDADGGDGIDTLDTSTYDSGLGFYRIDLQTGTTNFDETLVNFENLISGDTDDIVTGTTGANRIQTNGGDDSIEGGLGDDTIDGGDGDDTATYATATSGVTVRLISGVQNTGGAGMDRLSNIENLTGSDYADTLVGNSLSNSLDGKLGADQMRGGKGDDFFIVDNVGDVVIEADGEGSDTVNSTVTYSLAGQYAEVLNLFGDAAINGTGNSLANRIVGNDATNILVGGDGSDRLDGRGGADTMKGGLGNDVFVVDNALDKIVENDGEGTDTVEASFSYSLAGQYIEILKLMGSGDLNGTGNSLANTLNGNDGNNILNGAAGADTMAGGAGDDRYIVDNAGDVVIELINAGYDVVESAVTFSIAGQYVEELRLTGSAAINGTGNGIDNHLYGNGAINTLNGGTGNDNLHGGLGSDTLTGGAGLDTFWFETTLGASNVDKITDFNVADDTIYLDRTIFSGITADGALASTAYFQGTAAHDADDRIVYDKATGKIYYDADGNGPGAAVLFAQVTANTALTVSDFFAVA